MRARSEPTFSMRVVRPFLRVLAGRPELPQDDILRLDGRDPDSRLPTRVVLGLLRAAVEATGDPDLGLHAALATDRGEYELPEFVAASSATYRESIAAFRRYTRLLDDSLSVTLQCRGDQAIVKLQSSVPLDRTAIDYVVASFHLGYVRRARDGAPPVVEVWFRHEQPQRTEAYREVFGRVPVRFGALSDAVVFDPHVLDRPPPDSDPKLHQLLRRLADERLAEIPPTEALTPRVRAVVAREVRRGHATADHVARVLHMSRRTLARRLGQEGTHFKGILDDVRRELARRHLASDDLPLEEIALRLGYADAAAFHRAFRRWYGIAPGKYRRRKGIGSAPATRIDNEKVSRGHRPGPHDVG